MTSETPVAGSPVGAGPHVAVLAFPFGTHAAPLLAAVRRLAASAPSARFSFFSTAHSNAAVFSSSSSGEGGSGNVKAYEVADGVPDGHIELFVEAAPAAFRVAMEAAVGEAGREVSCIVGDAFLWFASEMAAEKGVPWVAFWTAGPTSLASHFYTDAIRHKFVGGGGAAGSAGHEDETLEFIPGLSEVKVRDLPEGVVFGNLESVFSTMLHKMGLALPRAAAVFINSFEELHPPTTTDLKSKLNNFLNVGPFNLHLGSSQQEEEAPTPDPHACLQWLDKHRPSSVVYVCFGSFVSPPQPELIALAEALEASRLPFLWSLRDNAKAQLPQRFPTATGKVVPWAPQTEVLAHAAVGAFVTHCGWNSLLESMAGGVPMICRPFLGDQRLNVRMVESTWGTGVGVEGGAITKSGLMKTLDLVLSQEQGQRMRARIKKLKEAAEIAVGPHGSSANNLKALSKIVFMQKNTAT